MKRILPRFFRCLLIAALVAAIAGPLAPTGTAIGDSIPCDDPPYFVNEGGVEPTATVRAVITSPFTFEVAVSGTRFPARTALSALKVGSWNGLPSPPPMTDESGSFMVTLTVPPGSHGDDWPVVVRVRVADIERSAPLILPCPRIDLSTPSARPGDTITITGTAFTAFADVDTINIGVAPALPVPNPLTDGVGDFSANVTVPTLKPGAYTVTVRTGRDYTATVPINIIGGENARPPEEAFQELTSRGLLTLAAASAPGGKEFGAYVPGLPGDTLAMVEPGGVLVLTLAKDARISVSGQPAVDVAADTPTFFALGSEVSVEVVS